MRFRRRRPCSGHEAEAHVHYAAATEAGLDAVEPTLPRYHRSVRAYAAALTEG
jgi:hypothetical protein